MRATTTFLRGEVAASNQSRKKTLSTWKQQETGRKQNFDKRGDFMNQQRSERRRDKFTLLTKSPREILALDKGKIKTPPPMTTLIEKRNNNKFCWKAVARNQGAKTRHGKDQLKTAKKEEAFRKDKAMVILMVQPWQRVARQRVTQSFSPDPEILFPPLGDEDEVEGPMIIEAEIGATKERIKVAIHPEYLEQTIAIGSTLTEEGRKELCDLLRRNLDIFAWKLVDMTGVLRHIAEHRLNVREGCPPVRQKKRSQAPKRTKSIQEEVEKLVDPDIMKKVYYRSWLLNPEMVKKLDNNWRMCVDFKDLNTLCPKDGRVLQGLEINYTPMEKLVLALVHANKRLKRYFQAHPIIVITDQPIKQVLSKPKFAGRLQKLSIELGEYDIQYMPIISIKGQILADFIVERPEDDSLVAPMEVEEELLDPWTLFTDGSSCIDCSGAGLILTIPEGT
ncbi:reverse transcriptase domain-containing protein [Tanacetum coccineum]